MEVLRYHLHLPHPPGPVCIHSATSFTYDGKHGWDGHPQTFVITPTIAACGSISFMVYGADNCGVGGCNGGGSTSAVISVSALPSGTLTIIVGGLPSNSAGGGGGSFVCSGTVCEYGTVLIAAGGAGGDGTFG